MSDKQVVTYNAGIGFTGWLTLLFIALKLMGYIAWSWWWVWSPIWIPAVVILGITVIIGVIAAIASLF